MSDRPGRVLRLGELATAVGGRIVGGDSDLELSGVRTLERAGAGELSFCVRPGYRDQAARSRAAAILVAPELEEKLPGRTLLVVPDPQAALGRILASFYPVPEPEPGIHPTAVVAPGCEIDPTAAVGPYVTIGARSRIGARAELRSHAVVGRDCSIGAGSLVHPHAVLYDRTELGERVVIHAGTVLGADGFGYATRDGEHHKVPQVGRTVIESDVEVGALSAIDRATLEETRIGAGTKIDNLVQVGHNVAIGRRCLLCGQVGIAGSARLGDGVVMGGQSGAADNLEVGAGVQAAGRSAILQSVPAGRQVGGVPAIDLRRWRRQVAELERLGKLRRRVRALEKRFDRLDRL